MFQAIIDAMGEAMRRTRADYHLTLGQLIEILGDQPPNIRVVFDYDPERSPGYPISYRGHYCDLAFPPEPAATVPVTVRDLYDEAMGVLDQELTGYKGGEFKMDKDTPLWVAGYGESPGRAITGIRTQDDHLVLVTLELESDDDGY